MFPSFSLSNYGGKGYKSAFSFFYEIFFCNRFNITQKCIIYLSQTFAGSNQNFPIFLLLFLSDRVELFSFSLFTGKMMSAICAGKCGVHDPGGTPTWNLELVPNGTPCKSVQSRNFIVNPSPQNRPKAYPESGEFIETSLDLDPLQRHIY